MTRKVQALLLIVFVLPLAGWGGELTKEEARAVIEKALADSRKSFNEISFVEGSEGFEYIQTMIKEGKFVLENEELRRIDLSKEKGMVEVYAPVSDLDGVFRQLEIKQTAHYGKMTNEDLKNIFRMAAKGESKQLKKICVTYARLSKETVQSIDNILNDKAMGTAMVTYTVAEVGIAPYYEELCALMYPGKSNHGRCRLAKPYTTQIQLKKYDDGWGIDLNPY